MVNCHDQYRRTNSLTDLHDAVLRNSTTDLESGLASGVPPDVVDHAGRTALYYACEHGYTTHVAILLQHGAGHDIVDMNGASPLWIASKEGHAEIAHTLLKQGALPDQKAHDQTTALYQASYEGHVMCVFYLTEYNASVNLAKNSGASPLFVAARNGHYRIVKRLLEKGADPTQSQQDMRTPLQTALLYNQTRCVRLLLRRGKLLTLSLDMYGWSPLHFSAKNGHLKGARMCLRHLKWHGSEEELLKVREASDWVGNTPLHIAVLNRHTHLSRYLMQEGFDVHQPSVLGWSPFLLAIAVGVDNDLISHMLEAPISSRHMTRGREIALQYRQYTILPLLICSSTPSIDLFNTCSPPISYLKHLLSLDMIGLIRYTPEEKVIQHKIETYVQQLLLYVQQSNPLFQNSLIRSGSYYEGTRVGVPDEFDYMINLTEIERLCAFEEYESDPAGFGRLRALATDDATQALASYIDPVSQCVSSEKVRKRFHTLLTSARRHVICPDSLPLFGHLKLEWTSGDKRCGATINAEWYGCQHAYLRIKIDVIPCITVRGWPRVAIQNCPLAEPEFHVITRSIKLDQTYLWRISTSRAEVEHFRSLTPEKMHVYVCLKALRSVNSSKCMIEKINYTADDLVTSYMLKSEFFYELARHPGERKWAEHSLFHRVLNILKRLRRHLYAGRIKSYFIENYNVLDCDESKELRSFEIKYVRSLLAHLKDKTKTDSGYRSFQRRHTIAASELPRSPLLRD